MLIAAVVAVPRISPCSRGVALPFNECQNRRSVEAATAVSALGAGSPRADARCGLDRLPFAQQELFRAQPAKETVQVTPNGTVVRIRGSSAKVARPHGVSFPAQSGDGSPRAVT
jgi:hypothetical protein